MATSRRQRHGGREAVVLEQREQHDHLEGLRHRRALDLGEEGAGLRVERPVLPARPAAREPHLVPALQAQGPQAGPRAVAAELVDLQQGRRAPQVVAQPAQVGQHQLAQRRGGLQAPAQRLERERLQLDAHALGHAFRPHAQLPPLQHLQRPAGTGRVALLGADQERQLVVGAPVVADEVEHRQVGLALVQAQAPAELLQEDDHRLGRPQEAARGRRTGCRRPR